MFNSKISEDGQILGKIQSTDRILNEKNFWDDIYINVKATPAYGVAWNKLYKRDVFENLRYREGILNSSCQCNNVKQNFPLVILVSLTI